MNHEEEKVICIQSEQELRILMLPLRQRMLKAMRRAGRPMTAKELSVALGITPSSAAHHLKKLQSLGIVALDHSELIHGIQAHYMRLVPATISLFSQNEAGLDCVEATVQNIVSSALNGFLEAMRPAWESKGQTIDSEKGDIMSGVVHLTQAEVDELDALLRRFFEQHDQCREGTHPWDYLVMGFRTDADPDRSPTP